MLPINECCKHTSHNGVLFEDKLFSHKKRKEHLDFAQKLEKCPEPLCYDPGFTFHKQLVDRNIGREA